jgi:mono/diheme cytochrome c family protein
MERSRSNTIHSSRSVSSYRTLKTVEKLWEETLLGGTLFIGYICPVVGAADTSRRTNMSAKTSSGIKPRMLRLWLGLVCSKPFCSSACTILLLLTVALLPLLISGCKDARAHSLSPRRASSPSKNVVVIVPSANALTHPTTTASVVEIHQPEIAYGRELFLHSCASCHGTSAQGLPRQGATLRASRFIADLNDEDLLAFLQTGRKPQDPQNASRVQMPPRGNPSLDDSQLRRVIGFLRHVQEIPSTERASAYPPQLRLLASRSLNETLVDAPTEADSYVNP